MSEISKEQVLHVAHLARLEMSEKEAESFSDQLADIIAMADTLNGLNTENIEPTSHVFAQKNVMRDDKKVEGLPLDQVMKNVPDQEDGQIKVPSIID